MNISYDGGFSHWKLINKNKRIIFPSVGGQVISSGFELLASSNGLQIESDYGTWQFGDKALLEGKTTRYQNSEWILTDFYLSALLASIAKTSAASRIETTLMTGLPYSDFRNDSLIKKFKKHLIGKHQIKLNTRSRQSVTIQDVKIIPQNLGAIFYHTMDGNGSFKKDLPNKLLIGLFNIGGHTVEMSTVQLILEPLSFDVVGEQSRSEAVGIYSLVPSIKVATEYKFDDFECMEFIKNWHDRQEIPVGLSRSVFWYIDRLQALVTQNWSTQFIRTSFDKLDMFILSGGGASLLSPYFSKAVVSDTPQWDTVLGYQKLFNHLEK